MNILLGIGAGFVGLLTLATVVKYVEVSKARRWEQVPGRVLASRVRSRKVKTTESLTGAEAGADRDMRNFADLRYEYKVAGKTYQGKRISVGEDIGDFMVEQRLARFPVGAIVTVYYDPRHPEKAVLERDAPDGVFRTLFIFIAVCIALLIGAAVGFPLLVEALRTNLARPERATVIVALAALTLFVAAITRAAMKQAESAQSWPAVEGEIEAADLESFHVRRLRDDTFRWTRVFRPAIVYRYQVGGNEFRGSRLHFASRLYSVAPGHAQGVLARYPIGSKVAVYYNPDNASEAVLQPVVRHLWVAWTAVAGLVVLLAIVAFT